MWGEAADFINSNKPVPLTNNMGRVISRAIKGLWAEAPYYFFAAFEEFVKGSLGPDLSYAKVANEQALLSSCLKTAASDC